MRLRGLFYLTGGAVVEEIITIHDTPKQPAKDAIKKLKAEVQGKFRENADFQFSFGNAIFRGADISAIQFTPIKDNEAGK